MGSRRGGNIGGGVGGGVAMIPTGSRKMVDSLKEIVKNHPDSEIYAALKECNMDPNEAVSRLLSQDPFHEVKSKKDKRKENKDAPESRPHGASSYGRGSKGSADRYAGRGGLDSALHGKSTYAYKENGFSTTKSTRITGSVTTKRMPTINDSVETEKKLADDVSPTPQYSSGYQPAWVGVPGKMSMADIVKMGKPHSKATNGSSNESWPQANVSSQSFAQRSGGALDENWHLSQDDQTSPAQQHDEWPLIEQRSAAARNYSVPDPPTSQLHPDSSTMEFNRTSEHQPQFDEVPEAQFNDTDNVDSAGDSPMVSGGSLHDSKFVDDNSGGADNDLDRYQPSLNHGFDGTEVEDADASVSAVAANMQQISIQEEEQVASPERDGPSVVIPEHLQVQPADCLNLSFGSFGSGVSATPSGDLASATVETHVEDTSVDADAPPVGHLTNVSSEYYGDEDLRSATGDILFHRTEAVSENYEQPSDSQPESLKVEYPEAEAAQSNQYSFTSSKPADYTYENSQSPNVAFSQSQPSSHTKNNTSFTNAMGYSSSLPSNLLTANVHAGRESEHSYSPFSSQAMPPKYNNSVSISGGSSLSMPEALKAIGLSSTHLTQQSLNGSNIATGPAIHQHLALHPYSQQTLPVGPFTNIISYPYMPQSYTYMPPGFQQPPFAAGNSSYQQSLAALLPQYKSSVSVSSLPPPAAAGVASGYGGAFGNSGGAIHGSFPMHPSAAPSTSLGIDDGLSSRYKDINHLMSLQQGDNSGMWVPHGHSSRTMSAPPTNPYYNIQGHNQPPGGGFRQVPQQSSQNHASLGYPNFYHSQAGISLDHHHQHHHLQQQQQHLRDGSLAGGQVQQPKPSSQQLWQNGY